MRTSFWFPLALCAAAAVCRGQSFPDKPGKAVFQRACGSCHAATMVLGRAMDHDQWSALVANMVTKGAKISDADFTVIVNYLAESFPPGAAAASGSEHAHHVVDAGPDDEQVVDPAAAARGRTVYIAECVTCHGAKARGARDDAPENLRGPDLVRSLIVLHDRYGSTIGPFLAQGHPMQSGHSSTSLSQAQILGLSHFLHAMVDETLRGGPYSQPVNILTGDAAAGRAFFAGAGGCGACHSPAGDLSHIASRYDAVSLQQRLVFPNSTRRRRGARMAQPQPVMITVTPPAKPPVKGVLVHIDDFNVALRDESGTYHSWKRTADLKVDIHDPYAAHIKLLNVYTDKNIHDLLAYLETLK